MLILGIYYKIAMILSTDSSNPNGGDLITLVTEPSVWSINSHAYFQIVLEPGELGQTFRFGVSAALQLANMSPLGSGGSPS